MQQLVGSNSSQSICQCCVIYTVVGSDKLLISISSEMITTTFFCPLIWMHEIFIFSFQIELYKLIISHYISNFNDAAERNLKDYLPHEEWKC